MYNLVGFLKGLLLQNEVDVTKQLVIQVSPSATTGTSTTVTAQQTANRAITLPDSSDTLVGQATPDVLSNKTLDNSNTVVLKDTNFILQDNLDTSKQIEFDASLITSGQTRTFALPDLTTTIVGTDAAQTLTQKSINAMANNITNIADPSIKSNAAIALSKLAATTANRVLQSDGSGVISASAVTNTTLGFLDATSSIQTQLNSKPTSAGAFVDTHILKANGTTGIQNSGVAIDSSNNMSGIGSITTAGLALGVASSNTIAATAASSLRLSAPSNDIIMQNDVLMLSNPLGTLVSTYYYDTLGQQMRLSAPTSLGGTFALSFPSASGTLVGDVATQNLSNKTFTDAITGAQIATPSNPVASKNKLYFKSDNNLYSLNSGGSETQISGTGLINPMTTQGDMIVGGAVAGAATRLPGGTTGQILTYDTSATNKVKWADKNFALSSSCGSFSTTSGSFVDITNLTATLVCTGRPVMIALVPDGTTNQSFWFHNTSGNGINVQIVKDGATVIANTIVQVNVANVFMTNSWHVLDVPTAASHTYKAQAKITSGGAGSGSVVFYKLLVYEL